MGENFEIKTSLPAYFDFTQLRAWEKYVRGEGSELLRADGILSGLAITLYDPETRRGVVAHISWKEKGEWDPENVVETLLGKIGIERHVGCRRLQASLVGEGVLPPFEKRNSMKVEGKIREFGINLIGSDLERWTGEKIVFLHCKNGKVEVYRV
jgi:chemotaxis receptor (MCP) glutamine deamidase CheD